MGWVEVILVSRKGVERDAVEKAVWRMRWNGKQIRDKSGGWRGVFAGRGRLGKR